MGRPGAMWEGANVLGGARIRLAGRLMRDRHGLITTLPLRGPWQS